MISKFEILDGQPFETDTIPIRLYVGAFELTPTYKHINSFFSIKYFLKILILDNEDRAYSKEQEIIFYRKKY